MIDISIGGGAKIQPTTTIPLGMDRFRGISSSDGGPAKSNRFLVQISGGPFDVSELRDLSFLCEATELPGRGFMSTDIRYYGPNFKAPYQTVYEDMNLTFICRDKFRERKIFDDWLDMINPVSSYNFFYRKDYTSTIKLHQFAETADESRYSFTFEDAYPILVSPQPVTWADDNFHRLTVSFTYVRWYREGFDPIRPVDETTSDAIAERLKQLNINEIDNIRPYISTPGGGGGGGGW